MQPIPSELAFLIIDHYVFLHARTSQFFVVAFFELFGREVEANSDYTEEAEASHLHAEAGEGNGFASVGGRGGSRSGWLSGADFDGAG